MSKWFSKDVDFNIALSNPPLNNKYSPAHPNVNGQVTIKFLEQLKKVSNIKCGLVGTADVMYYASEIEYGGFQTSAIRRTLVTQTIEFFNTFDDLPLSCDNCDDKNCTGNVNNDNKNSYSFDEGEKLEFTFNFEFPNILFLPSSCKTFGNIDGAITINYELYTEIYRSGKFITFKTKKHSSFKLPIYYQSGMDPLLPKTVTNLNYKKSELFKDKVKKFYFDDNANALIPSSLNRPHSKTKFIRQLWNDNYKPEIYNTITKSIPITLGFSIRSAFDLNETFSSQIALTILSDLISVGIKDNQSKDFVFNGQSTNLGLIKIESLNVETINKIHLQCNQYIISDYTKESILKITFKDLIFDIKDFSFDKMANLFKHEVPIDLLSKSADIDINQSLMEIMGSNSIMTTGFVPDWFGNTVKLNFTWKISDGGSQRMKFEFKTTSTPDFLFGMPNNPSTDVNDASFVPPPTYEESKEDKEVVAS